MTEAVMVVGRLKVVVVVVLEVGTARHLHAEERAWPSM